MTEVLYVRLPVELPATYAYGPDSFRRPGVPEGTTHEYTRSESDVFPGTTRRYWVYVPARYTPSVPASLMVFQTGTCTWARRASSARASSSTT